MSSNFLLAYIIYEIYYMHILFLAHRYSKNNNLLLPTSYYIFIIEEAKENHHKL